jgi:hypothetical protein
MIYHLISMTGTYGKHLFSCTVAWSSLSRSHDSCTWPPDIPHDSLCPYTSPFLFVKYQVVVGKVQEVSPSQVNTVYSSDFVALRVGGKGQVFNICSSTPFSRHGSYPRVTSICQIYESWEGSFRHVIK